AQAAATAEAQALLSVGGGADTKFGNTKSGKGTRATRGKGGGAGAVSSAKVLHLFDAIFQKISIAEALQ
ncbi:unnamed protein product, partial [Prorocentrum cordatum]